MKLEFLNHPFVIQQYAANIDVTLSIVYNYSPPKKPRVALCV